jgi:superfamily II DNA or RNA helicase
MTKLRDYQETVLVRLAQARQNPMVQRIAVVLPTGAGKTVIMAHQAAEHAEAYGDRAKTIIIVDRDELVSQTLDQLAEHAPDLRVGVVKAERDDHSAPCVVASIQTLSRPSRLLRVDQAIRPDWERSRIQVIVDECDLAAAESYQRVFRHFGLYAPGGTATLTGYTATLTRADRRELADTFQLAIEGPDILDMIKDGWLCDVEGRQVTVDGLSLDEAVRGSDGEFTNASLARVLKSSDAVAIAADAYVREAGDRPGIAFWPDVATARDFVGELARAGVSCLPVWGDMDPDMRKWTMAQVRSGAVQVLANCMVLTRGFDWRGAQVAMIARQCLSPGLYVQMAGRVLRTYPGKDKALILDVSGASELHRLATITDLSRRNIPDPLPGESLMAAAKRGARDGNATLMGYVAARDVDLFRRSKACWLKTRGGVWFVATSTSYYVLWPDRYLEMYKVGRFPTRSRGRRPEWLASGVSFDFGMEMAEELALAEDPTLAGRSASWRRRRNRPSERALQTAKGAGIDVPQGISAAELADLMTIEFASRKFDPALELLR